MKKNNFKVGDRVRLVSIENEEESIYKPCLGKIFTVSQVGARIIELKNSRLMPYYYNLEKVTDTLETTYDFKNAPLGTKLTFKNGVILVKDGETLYENSSLVKEYQNLDKNQIKKIEEPTYRTVYEYISEILDEDEKRYLKQVIRPFKDRVKYIAKHRASVSQEIIMICVDDNYFVNLPLFERHTMYKNMKIDEHYTLEDLNI